MVKAGSLLYAIYVCLLVGLLCGALLYIATMYNQLNIYYTLHDDLYIQNQSYSNYSLINGEGAEFTDEDGGIHSYSKIRPYGALSLLEVTSVLNTDSIVSLHLLGTADKDRTCIYVPRSGSGLAYSGTVTLSGEKKLPEEYIRPLYIDNKPNKLDAEGKVLLSGPELPELSDKIKKGRNAGAIKEVAIEQLSKNNSCYYNSFLNNTLRVNLKDPLLSGIEIRGNIILESADSIVVSHSAQLQDVILVAPKIIFKDGFKGAVQAFASQKIVTEENVMLEFPSVLYIDNRGGSYSLIAVSANNKIYGAVLLAGNTIQEAEKHEVNIAKSCTIVGTLYCSGTLILESNVTGNVYANRLRHITASSKYDNCIADIEINAIKMPVGYTGLPIFEQSKNYDIIKKVL